LNLSPRILAELAIRRKVQLLALTDHNSSLNCPAFAKACLPLGILPLFGLEATTQEEIHVLCLFTSLEASLDFSGYAYSILLPFPNNPEKTGDQVYVDDEDNIEGEVEYYLLNPLELTVDNIGAKVAEYGGIVIPAHVDRHAFSVTSQLGVMIKGPWDAVECTRLPAMVNQEALDTLAYPLITSSDAHFPEHVARRPFELDASLEELAPNGLLGGADINVLRRALAKRPII
jgi:hypothetical protein